MKLMIDMNRPDGEVGPLAGDPSRGDQQRRGIEPAAECDAQIARIRRQNLI